MKENAHSSNCKDEYIDAICKLMQESEDLALIDLVFQLLVKSKKSSQ